MLSIRNLSKTYSKGGKRAVDGLSLEVRDGEILGLLGPNGAGKTTTLKMITGILKADAGEVQIAGYDLATNPLESKQQFAFVPDEADDFLRLKGTEYLRFIADIYGVPEEDRRQRVNALADRFEMQAVLGDRLESYSHGMRQKIVLIAALLHNPPLWILDEPMTGLDPRGAYNLKLMMREHARQGKSVLFSTHVLEVAEKVCDRIAIIDDGKLRFVGTMTEMRQTFHTDADLESIFLRLTDDGEPEDVSFLDGADGAAAAVQDVPDKGADSVPNRPDGDPSDATKED